MSNEAELLALEEKRLEIEERKADLEYKKLANVAARRKGDQDRMADENRHQNNLSKGKALVAQRPEVQYAEKRRTCNHRMGGKGRENFVQGRGSTNEQGCVVKTKLPTGDVMVKCPRCRSVYVPPWDANFYFGPDGKWKAREEGGVFSKEKFTIAQDRYNEAYNLPTDLAMVLTPQYRWSKGGKAINREVTYRYVRTDVESPASAYYEAKSGTIERKK